MRTYTKSNFLGEYKTPLIECACELSEDEVTEDVEALDELVGGDGAPIGGAIPDGNEANIQTGPVQKPKKSDGTSQYVKGIATTTDDAKAKTSQGPDWQAAFGGLGGAYYSRGQRNGTGSWVPWVGGSRGLVGDMDMDTDSDGVMEGNMTKMVEKMLNKKDDEISVKKVDWDLSKKAHIEDLISKIKDLEPEAKKKLEKLLSDAKS